MSSIQAFSSLTTQEKFRYVGAFVGYNIGSLFVGGFRAYVAVKNLSNHLSNVEDFMSVKTHIPYKTEGSDTNTVTKLDSEALKSMAESKQTAIHQLGWRFPQEQRSFWWGQLIRAITEIALPIIGSLVWTIYDVMNSSDEKLFQSGNFNDVRSKNGGPIPGKLHIDTPQFSDRAKLFKYDIAGYNSCKLALKWEDDMKALLPAKDKV